MNLLLFISISVCMFLSFLSFVYNFIKIGRVDITPQERQKHIRGLSTSCVILVVTYIDSFSYMMSIMSTSSM
ncbi:hypothetical protein [Clostridium disporicum]|uniref:hypothetical protein n=1 Tax=Clostridium disporicum TaxID=84024 RepID=UPI0034A552E6